MKISQVILSVLLILGGVLVSQSLNPPEFIIKAEKIMVLCTLVLLIIMFIIICLKDYLARKNK